MQQVSLQATLPSDGNGWSLETQYKENQLMIVVMHAATLGVIRALRMPSVGQTGKLLMVVIVRFLSTSKLHFLLAFPCCVFSPCPESSPELFPLWERPALLTRQDGSNGG